MNSDAVFDIINIYLFFKPDDTYLNNLLYYFPRNTVSDNDKCKIMTSFKEAVDCCQRNCAIAFMVFL